jgi:hypothetical protein
LVWVVGVGVDVGCWCRFAGVGWCGFLVWVVGVGVGIGCWCGLLVWIVGVGCWCRLLVCECLCGSLVWVVGVGCWRGSLVWVLVRVGGGVGVDCEC